MMPGAPRCAAVRYPKSRANDAELLELRRRAWRDAGLACIEADRVADDWLRLGIINLCDALYGPRRAPAVKRENTI